MCPPVRGLREEQSTLTAGEKSAEGIVGDLQERLARHSEAEGGATDMLNRNAITRRPKRYEGTIGMGIS